MKYIKYSPLNIILFPEHISHREMAEAVEPLIKKPPKSAGYCQIDGQIKVFGDSQSLGLQPHPDDSKLISELLRKTYNE
jgi:hypothetical protein